MLLSYFLQQYVLHLMACVFLGTAIYSSSHVCMRENDNEQERATSCVLKAVLGAASVFLGTSVYAIITPKRNVGPRLARKDAVVRVCFLGLQSTVCLSPLTKSHALICMVYRYRCGNRATARSIKQIVLAVCISMQM